MRGSRSIQDFRVRVVELGALALYRAYKVLEFGVLGLGDSGLSRWAHQTPGLSLVTQGLRLTAEFMPRTLVIGCFVWAAF